jgi:glycosyltransferase involved in cell wall biosynthesis
LRSHHQNIPSGRRIGVMQVVDTLDIGGAEKIAVQLANLLPPDRFVSYLCTTRRDGPLEVQVAPHVVRVRLNRTGRFDSAGIHRMASFIAGQDIRILHAHGSSLFISRIASLVSRLPIVLWHDHYGRCELGDRSAWLYRIATHGIGVIAVNHPLAEWSRTMLGVPADHIWYVPNWVDMPPVTSLASPLPGTAGRRIVCVANLRAQKDHMTLLRAMVHVKKIVPDANLLLVGYPMEPAYAEHIRAQTSSLQLKDVVSSLGPREDVGAILQASDIGVLSSASEGLPLSLLEYGTAGLAVVATDVGQCREVLDEGRAGLLVPPSAPDSLAEALIGLLHSSERRAALGAALRKRVSTHYDPQTIVGQICEIYRSLLAQRVA